LVDYDDAPKIPLAPFHLWYCRDSWLRICLPKNDCSLTVSQDAEIRFAEEASAEPAASFQAFDQTPECHFLRIFEVSGKT
jgi:hypothetical protein